MRVLLKHAKVVRRALRSAEFSNKLGEAACIQCSLPTPCALPLRCLHASAAASASEDDVKQNGNVEDNGNRLPENATAKEMRQWADRMLGHSAQKASLTEASAPAAEQLAEMEQEIEEDASKEEQEYSKVQAVQESEAEDDAFREEQSFDRAHAAGPSLGVDREPEVPSEAAAQHQEEESRETTIADDLGLSEDIDKEYRDAAAAMRTVQGMPGVMEAQSRTAESGAMEVAAPGAQGAQDKPQEEQKWQSFMAEHFGTDVTGAADVGLESGDQPPPLRSPQSRIFDITDPRKELDKLLPEEFRRFDVADKSYVKSQAGSYSGQAASEPPPKRITVMEPPVDHRADPVTGYARLGLAGQNEDTLEKMPDKFMERQDYLDKMRRISAQQRIHPTRTFYPGQTYQPEELAPESASAGAAPWQLPVGAKPGARVKKASNATVRAQADFRNQAFLNTFISELGKLPPKRTTRLQQKTHRHLCRQIKLARQMALLPIDSRLKPSYLARAGGLSEVPSTIEDNPVLAHLLPPNRRPPAPRDF